MTHHHVLITQLCDELDHYRRMLMDDRQVTHPLADRVRAVLATDGPAVPESREPTSVVGEPSDQEIYDLWTGAEPASFARAVLARWGRQPAPPDEGEVEFPTTQELKTFACEWWRTFGLVKNKATCTWVLDQADPEHFADFARDVLARWGQQSAPPAEGEVAELVAELQEQANYGICDMIGDDKLIRAADLLAQRHPTPVPVASDIYFEFVISDADYCTQAGGIAPTYAQALSEGQHYLAQYQQDGPHTLELRRVEVLNPAAACGGGER